jgi:UDPglucose 6-dehydrogenase
MDPRIGLDYMRAGLGYGGSCLPKDTAILSGQFKAHGHTPLLLDAVREVNDSQAVRLVDRVERVLGGVAGKRIAVLGLAFKSDTDDTRHSPAVTIIHELVTRDADVVYYDPKAVQQPGMFPRVVASAHGVLEAAADAEAVIVATDWREFKAMDLEALHGVMKGSLLADVRNMLPPEEAVAAGFRYLGVGRPERTQIAEAPALAGLD